MSLAVGVDRGGIQVAGGGVAVRSDARRSAIVLSITTQRAGFTNLDAWMAKQGAPIDVCGDGGRAVTTGSTLASHLRRQGYPVAGW